MLANAKAGQKRPMPADDRPAPAKVRAADAAGGGGGFWQRGLRAAASDPASILSEDEHCRIIADKYPKARHHFLVLPKRDVDSLAEADVALLRQMLAAAQQLLKDRKLQDLRFRFGFHAVPSMSQLHMHAISQDFDSVCLKTKKHWNSFTTSFFLDCELVIRLLESDESALDSRVSARNGRLSIDKAWFAQLLKSPLACHRCEFAAKNLPALKRHLLRHS